MEDLSWSWGADGLGGVVVVSAESHELSTSTSPLEDICAMLLARKILKGKEQEKREQENGSEVLWVMVVLYRVKRAQPSRIICPSKRWDLRTKHKTNEMSPC